ncbi:MAG: VOC family protein [Oscillospiraceae bacterium]
MPLMDLNFEVVHFGVNCENEIEALEAARAFEFLFGIAPIKNSKDSVYSGPLVELMKGNGRGRHGHIGIACDDIHRARELLENKGIEFDEGSVKYDDNGSLLVIYMKKEIAGFAVHIIQRTV